MQNKKAKIIFNLFFMLLGLALAVSMLFEGLDTTHNWFSLVIGSLVAIDCFRRLLQIKKEDNSRTETSKRK